MVTKTSELLKRMKKSSFIEKKTPIATDIIIPNLSGDLSRGSVRTTPGSDLKPANKKYVDDAVAGASRLWEVDGTTNCTQLKTADEINLLDRFLYFDTLKAVGLDAVSGDLGVGLESGKVLKMNTHKITGVIDPTAAQDAATKKYVDDNAGGTPEGTAVKSTGEEGAIKFLREDGDNSCSWQVPAGAGDVTAAANLTNETIVQGDGGAKGVKTSTATVAQVAANVSHVAGDGSDHADVATNSGARHTQNSDTALGSQSEDLNMNSHQVVGLDAPAAAGEAIRQTAKITEAKMEAADDHVNDNTQAHTDYLLNNGNDTTTGTITAAGLTTTGVTLTGDHGTAATDQVVNVCYGTGAAPTANTTTIGTLFVKYTA